MKINDVLSGALVGAFGLAVLAGAQGFPAIPGQRIGPGVFPELVAAGMLICAVFLVKRGLGTLAGEGWVRLPDWLGHRRATLGFLLIPLSLGFYVAVSEQLGFIPTAIALLMAMFLAFGVNWRSALLVALPGTLIIHFLFYKMLKVPLPWGLLSPYAW
jgi:putative tricarboxylic transport membrane protein